ENDSLWRHHSMFFRKLYLCQRKYDFPLNDLLWRLRVRDGVPYFFSDGLRPHLSQGVSSLVCQVFFTSLFHMFDEIDARDPQAYIPTKFFGHEPFMSQNPRPQVSGGFGIKSDAADFEYFIHTRLRRGCVS